jgi:hypothetical protein
VADELEEYDQLRYKMVDGETFTRDVPAGTGKLEISEGTHDDWIALGDETRIRTDKIVSIRLTENAHEGPNLF